VNYMLLFLLACASLGLWRSPRAKHARVVLVLAAALVLLFFISPSKM
jgi:Na+/H+ antiporter NhaC